MNSNAQPPCQFLKCKPSILDLPSAIRNKIFLFAGVHHNLNLDLGHRKHVSAPEPEPDMEYLYQMYPDARPQQQESSPGSPMLSLLLTCSVFHDEIMSLLYQSNSFMLKLNDRRGFNTLENWSSSLIKNLRFLTIRLSMTDCENVREGWKPSMNPQSGAYYESRGVELDLEWAEDQYRVERWCSLWHDSIMPHLTPEPQLDLKLICDIADKDTARAVLEPFLAADRPLLKHCSIRIVHCSHDEELCEIVKTAAVTATTGRRPQPRNGIFRFFDLPVEVRQHILQYTDLVNQDAELRWNESRDAGSRNPTERDLYGLAVLPHGSDRPCHTFDQCGELYDFRCRDAPEFVWWRHDPCRDAADRYFCPIRHIAWTTDQPEFGSRYLQIRPCCRFPTSILLVSRQMHQEGIQVVYSRNRISIVPDRQSITRGWKSAPDCLPITDFVSSQTDPCDLYHLRHLDIILPSLLAPVQLDVCATSSVTLQNWLQTIDTFKQHLNLSALTIEIWFLTWTRDVQSFGINVIPRNVHVDTMMEHYANVVRPLARLAPSLFRLFVHLPVELSRPWTTVLVGSDRPNGSGRYSLERRLERMVMGRTHESAATCKSSKPPPEFVKSWHSECGYAEVKVVDEDRYEDENEVDD